MIPAMEQILDELSDEQTVISISKLEIDLGKINLNDEAAILEKWKQELRGKIAHIHTHTDAHVQVTPTATSIWEVFVNYLENGYLSWNYSRRSLKKLEEELLGAKLEYSENQWIRLFELLRNDKVFLRFNEQFSDDFFVYVFNKILDKNIFEKLASIEFQSWIQSIFAEKNTSREIKLAIVEGLNQSFEQLFFIDKKQNNIDENINEINISEKNDEKNAHSTEADKVEQLLEELNKQTSEATETELEAIYLNYAGIILLHPFLNTFFKELKLVENKQFINETAQERAVHLLYFLATGLTEPEEPDTVIFKFLCGLDMNFPIKKHLELSKKETAEAEQLLQSAIKHWEKLKNTSTDGLRQGFLQREGKLFYQNNKWQLIVEQRGIDVLLDYLPWGLSMVKLPWREDILHVTWA